eukprot:CAMPEP_0202691058 /NCGR_PEP_ID=MMETSP1385-20130828/5878_1 /ASSEMBLY_ACC=CAM_ASM_000861 /TAXON_ID=933848 /ORGANISM="Elphidium margaritaceum" /LENGTH=430 /DNA_ID=CAMNT_0049346403 /DNA_START=17 /DNA_END=1306 /DNA_ORIENTATION=-
MLNSETSHPTATHTEASDASPIKSRSGTLNEGSGGREREYSPENGKKKHTKLSLFQATALNTLNMFGTGPFITIPFVIAAANPPGPHALFGYGLACFVCFLDSLVWAELGSMWPLNGGTYVYLLQVFGHNTWGTLMSWLFVWQFLISGPMEAASGFIAMSQYLSYITGITTYLHHSLFAVLFGVLALFALYRNISDVGKFTVILWALTIAAILFTLVVGYGDFNHEYLRMPSNVTEKTGPLLWSMGLCARFGVYDFTGYFDVNYVGSEVANPKANIPKAGVMTCCYVCLIYILVNIAVLGYLPWDPAQGGFVLLVQEELDSSNYIMAIFAEKLWGRGFAIFFVIIVLVTIYASCFALMLGYAMIPAAAAKNKFFYAWFAHESKPGLYDRSLLFIGALTLICCFIPLDVVIEALLTTRLLIQFIAQSVGLW